MRTFHLSRIIALALIVALLWGCGGQRTIREYRTDQSGGTTVTNVTEEQYWKEKVDERIAAEIAKEKPESVCASEARGYPGPLRRRSQVNPI